MKVLTAVVLSLLSASSPASAADESGYTYAPPHCDFAVTFPEEPYGSRKCPEASRCYEVKNFTKVFEMQATVNFRVTCNKAEPGMFERYDGPTMQAVLRGMAGANNLQSSNTHFQAWEDAKIASLTGTGEIGRTPMVYATQIWIGKNSVFTIEGELIGDVAGPADAMFAEIIGSIRPANEPAEDDTAGEANAEEKDEEDKKQ